ncbi:helix-turn-helix transcriptional regulator [Streptomyces sp. NPDC006207]
MEGLLHVVIQDFQDDARVLLRQLGSADPEHLLDQVRQMRTRLECLTAGLVGNARLRQTTWSRVGQALAISEDTARHRYTDDYILRRLNQVAHPPSAPTSLRALYQEPPRHGVEEPGQDDEIPAVVEGSSAAYNQLAPVLSRLARASQLPLQNLARQARCSPSYLSRVLSGQRVPSWVITERFARACGADPAVLREVWESEQLRRRPSRDPAGEIDSLAGISTRTQALQRLMAALRTLHVRAGQPSARQISRASQWGLQPSQVTSILDGAEPCDWPTLLRLLDVLGGSPTYFHPLWLAAAQLPKDRGSSGSDNYVPGASRRVEPAHAAPTP